jgi:hypothetical protein
MPEIAKLTPHSAELSSDWLAAITWARSLPSGWDRLHPLDLRTLWLRVCGGIVIDDDGEATAADDAVEPTGKRRKLTIPAENVTADTMLRLEATKRDFTDWPRLMRVEQAAAYCGERSANTFRRAIGTLYPHPIKVPGKGERWLKEAIDQAIDRLSGKDDGPSLADILD